MQRQTFQLLSKREIDRRIERVMREVAERCGPAAESASSEARTPRPQWIEAREFVERMRPFLVYN